MSYAHYQNDGENEHQSTRLAECGDHGVLWVYDPPHGCSRCESLSEGGKGPRATAHSSRNKSTSYADVQKAILGLTMQSQLAAAESQRAHRPPLGAAKESSEKSHHVQVVMKSKLATSEQPPSPEAETNQFEIVPLDLQSKSKNDSHDAPHHTSLPQREAGARPLDPTVEAVLVSMQQHTVTITKKISCVRRGITPVIARAVAHRIRHFRNFVHEIDLSHNPVYLYQSPRT
jgi:hypothetical protein